MKKLMFVMIALVGLLASCSEDENNIITPAQWDAQFQKGVEGDWDMYYDADLPAGTQAQDVVFSNTVLVTLGTQNDGIMDFTNAGGTVQTFYQLLENRKLSIDADGRDLTYLIQVSPSIESFDLIKFQDPSNPKNNMTFSRRSF